MWIQIHYVWIRIQKFASICIWFQAVLHGYIIRIGKPVFQDSLPVLLSLQKINTKKNDPKKVLQIFINVNNGRMLMILFFKESLLLESQAILSVGKNLKQ